MLPMLAFTVIIAAQCAAIPAVLAMSAAKRSPPAAPGKSGAARPDQRPASFPAVCARRDLQAVTLIDLQGETQVVASERLFEAFLTVVRARRACRENGEAEGLSIYDALASSLSAAAPSR